MNAKRAETTARWVITGPAGAGKSLVTALLAARGAVIVEADTVGHELLERPEVRDALVAAFGAECAPEGRVDRAVLGGVVFADPAALARLNAITHPPLALELRQRLDAVVAAGETRLAVLEAAVYFLLPPLGTMDLTVAVTAPADLRLERLMRSGLDRAGATARIVAQRSLEATFHRADVVLANTGGRADLARSVDRLLAEHLDPPR